MTGKEYEIVNEVAVPVEQGPDARFEIVRERRRTSVVRQAER